MTNEIDQLPLLIQAEQLQGILQHPRLLLLDLSSAENYARHHLPGAIHLPAQSLQRGSAPGPGKLPELDALNSLFSRIGLTPDRFVVAYDDEGGGWAGRLIWTLDVIGHQGYAYLDGGLPNWLAERRPICSEPCRATPSHCQLQINRDYIAEIDEVLAAIDNPQYAIWDARSAPEYRGEKVLAKQGGHIPGAVNIDWLELMDKTRHLRLIDLDQLQQRLDQLGLSRDKTIITHCQTHHRSGLSYLAMKILGYPHIKGYHGSWSEWGNTDGLPVTTNAD